MSSFWRHLIRKGGSCIILRFISRIASTDRDTAPPTLPCRSFKRQMRVLVASLPVKEAIFCGASCEFAEQLIQSPAFLQLSAQTLTRLECHLHSFAPLRNFPNLRSLALLVDERAFEGPRSGSEWALDHRNAVHLAPLTALVDLCIGGYSTVNLHQVAMPHLKVRLLQRIGALRPESLHMKKTPVLCAPAPQLLGPGMSFYIRHAPSFEAILQKIMRKAGGYMKLLRVCACHCLCRI